jgi:hypothetical protein
MGRGEVPEDMVTEEASAPRAQEHGAQTPVGSLSV